MPEDRTTITADASQYFDVLGRAGAAGDRFSRTGDRIGEGFVRGERVVRTATANITAGLLLSNNAAATTLIALQGLERVFRIGILPTVAIAAGVAVLDVLHKQIERNKAAYEDLRKEIEIPLEPDTDAFTQRIDTLRDKMKKLKDENESFLSNFLKFLGRGTQGGLGRDTAFGGPAFRPTPSPKKSDAEKALDDAAVKVSDLAAARAKKIADGILDQAAKLHEALAEAVQKFRGATGNLFRDIGSGQFLKDAQQRNLENQQTSVGQEMAREFEDAIARGIPIGPNAQAIVKAARGAAERGGVGVQDILNADFSNLDVLSKYDFSGLAPLSGITIQLQ